MTILPNSISVGYQDIKISEIDFLDAQGVYRAEQSEIRIQEGLSKREALNTLIHECLHALVYNYGLKTEFKDDDHEEKIINALGNGLTELFLRNPKILIFIKASV